MTPPDASTCPTCGTAIPDGAPGGLCPKCLLGGGAGADDLDPAGEETLVDAVAGDPGGGRVLADPESIGPYRLLKPLGEGGMGKVFVAEQRKPIRRKVALKIIKPGMDSKEVLARFEAERQAVALMDHPGIARVFDAGATDDGRPYFVMELVTGSPLTEFCDEKKLSLRERLVLFQQICQAVQHAHQKGIIHRDLKPSNILVAVDDDGRPVPKIIDFGVAKALGPGLTEQTLFTVAGQLIGTPQYMSPEQAAFDASDIDTRSDIYALGVLLYELLTGSTPLEAATLENAGLEAMLRTIREQDAPKPSTRLGSLADATKTTIAHSRQLPPSKLTKTLRGDLDWVVMKALEKERGRRYETANAFAQDIRRYLEDEPVSASPPSPAYKFKKFVRRNKGAAIAASLVSTSLVLGLTASLWQTNRVTKAQAETTAAYKELALESYYEKISLAYLQWEAGDLSQANAILDSCNPARRHIEWGLLKQACQRDPIALPGIRNARRVRYTPKGTYLAVMHDHYVSLVPESNYENARVFQFGTELKDIDVDVEEHWLAILSAEGAIHVRSLDDERRGPVILHPDGHSFSALALGARGKMLAAGDADGFVFLFDAASGVLVNRFTGDTGNEATIRHVALSQNGSRLASGSQSGRIRIWDVASGQSVLNRNIETMWRPACFGLLFSSDDRRLINLAEFGVVTVRDSENGHILYKYDVHLGHQSLDFGLRTMNGVWHGGGGQVWDGNDLLLAVPQSMNEGGSESTGLVTTFELTTGQFHQNLSVPGMQFRSASFEPGGRSMATVSSTGQVNVWPLRSRGLNSGQLNETWSTFSTAISPDDRLAAIGSYGSIKVYDAETGVRIFDLGEPRTRGERRELFGEHNIRRLRFSPDGKQLAAGQEYSGKLTIVDMTRLKVSRQLQAHEGGSLHTVEYSPDGRHLVTANSGNGKSTVRLWNCDTWRLVHEIPVGKLGDRFDSATFGPDGKTLAVADPDRGLLLLDVSGSAPTEPRALAPNLTGPIRFSPDGESIAAHRGKDIVLIEVSSAKIQHTFSGHDSANISAIRYSKDGRRIVSVAYDGSMRVWDTENKRPALKISSPGSAFYDLAISHDDRWLLTGEQVNWKVDDTVSFASKRWKSQWPEASTHPEVGEEDEAPPYDWSRVKSGVSYSLLKLAAASGDILDGTASLLDNSLRIRSGNHPARLSVPVIPRGSYELEGTFSVSTKPGQHKIGVILPVKGHFTTLWVPDNDLSEISITRSNGKPLQSEYPQELDGEPLSPDRRYSFHARVESGPGRGVAISIQLDGHPVVDWVGDVRNLEIDRNFNADVHLMQCISLIAPADGEIAWHQLKLTMTDGQAWIIRP